MCGSNGSLFEGVHIPLTPEKGWTSYLQQSSRACSEQPAHKLPQSESEGEWYCKKRFNTCWRLLFGLDQNIENVPKKNYVGEVNELKEHIQDHFQDKNRLGNILLEKKDLGAIREQEITEKKETNQEKNQKNKSTNKEKEIVSLEKGEPVSKAKELSTSNKTKLQEMVENVTVTATPDSSKNLPLCSKRGVKLGKYSVEYHFIPL